MEEVELLIATENPIQEMLYYNYQRNFSNSNHSMILEISSLHNTNAEGTLTLVLCIYTHNNWYMINKNCSPAPGHFTIRCKPLYMPREFNAENLPHHHKGNLTPLQNSRACSSRLPTTFYPKTITTLKRSTA